MKLNCEEVKKTISDYQRLETKVKNICAEFMGGCPTGWVEDMSFGVIDSEHILVVWEEDIEWTYKHYERTIPLDWLSKSNAEIYLLISDILRKEYEEEERRKKKEEELEEKAKEKEERALYEELKKKFERKEK